MKVKAALLAKENQQDGLTTFSKAYFLWINFNASALLNSKKLKYTGSGLNRLTGSYNIMQHCRMISI